MTTIFEKISVALTVAGWLTIAVLIGYAVSNAQTHATIPRIGGAYVPALVCQEDEGIALTPEGIVCYNIEELQEVRHG